MNPEIIYLSTYPPRRCGIATFTLALRNGVGSGRVYALGSKDGASLRDGVDQPEVMASLIGHQPADFRRAAAAIDAAGADVVSIQHEYGIYGGPDGVNLLALTDRLMTPYVATLHTVRSAPTDHQRGILEELAGRSAGVVVMSRTAATLLTNTYDVDPSRIHVIPHGVPDLPRVDPADGKSEFGLAGRAVVLSFGLVGSGKGYELAIEAMRTVAKAVPEAVYVILGATHPDLVRREGEQYRESLRRQADATGLGDRVRFENRFVDGDELGRRLQSSDVFVTPYPNLDQIVSGTLSYAMAAGLPVVSTPYLYAREVLADGRGVLVPPGQPAVLGQAIADLLRSPDRRESIAASAYAYVRQSTWARVGAAYRGLFDEVAQRRVHRPLPAAARTLEPARVA